MQYLNNTKETVEYTNIAVAMGDGIGPEIMEVALKILKESGARIKCEFVEIGEKYYHKGYETGISDEAWDVIRRNKVFLKAPMTTPQGGGYKSINVTLRKALGQYANVRPCISYNPFVETKFPNIDVVIIRENEEDLYAGIEYRQTQETYTALKVITQKGCEKIVRYAFEYAKKNHRKKVTCMTKDNIMKGVDGLFHKTFDKIALEYPEFEVDHYIIDIGSARLANQPEHFDVVVTLNLYGDIISDIVAEQTGSVGLAGSANIGERYAMFEAIHGSAPAIVGMGKANPTALINATVMMLTHIGQGDIAKKINDALLYTIESGIHTRDIYREGTSKKQVTTSEFGDEVVKNLGKSPSMLKSKNFANFEFDSKPDKFMLGIAPEAEFCPVCNEKKELVGVDIFIDLPNNASQVGKKVEELLKDTDFTIKVVSARGIKVYPDVNAKYLTSDEWRLRIIRKSGDFSQKDVIKVIETFVNGGFDVIKSENLYNFNGKAGYSKSQGE